MPERITDQAWRQIVNVTSRGTRGLVFRMNRRTYAALCAERGVSAMHSLYSVPIVFETNTRDYVISLEER
jgi:hypothetical protein